MTRPMVAVFLALVVPSVSSAQHEHQHADSSFHAMQSRGRTAMGVDQYVSTHRFEPLPDGGRIELRAAAGDSVGAATIRAHFRTLAEAFSAGDFSTPEFVHAEPVPGTEVMAERKSKIRYRPFDLPAGGGLRITTTDPAAVAAVHRFLAFQSREHRTP
jgi:hypothetical protein